MPFMRIVVVLLGLLVTSPVQQPGLELKTARFYRTGTTLVDGFCRVPFSLLQSTGGNGAAYRIGVTVRDSAGVVLTDQSWSQAVREDLLAVSGASAVEHFTFAVHPGSGQFRVDVTVTDTATQRSISGTTTVEALALHPLTSDLLLTTSLRRPAFGHDSLEPGEIRKGSLHIVSATRPVLTPQSGKLFYYLELYQRHPELLPLRAMRGTIDASVLAADGRILTSAPQEEINVPGEGGVAAHGLDLTGLPPGSYQLQATIHLADTMFTRAADFGVSGFEVAGEVKELAGFQDEYTKLNPREVDSLYRPLVHIMEDNERGVFESLSLNGKRNFLRQFWVRRDPSPGTPVNESRDKYYKAIDEANRRFREGGAAEVPGWRTDRGRIFIRYGEPDEKLSRPQAGATRPYEVWKYTRGRPRLFVFMDETRFGHYVLLYTNERREPSQPNWESILGREAVQEIMRF